MRAARPEKFLEGQTAAVQLNPVRATHTKNAQRPEQGLLGPDVKMVSVELQLA